MLKKPYNKYRSKRVKTEKGNFDSKKEFNFFGDLLVLQRAGEVSFFLRQVPFHLPGKVKYIVDFVVFYKDGSVKFYDIKGFETPMFKLKKKQVEELYPVQIVIVK